MLRYEPPLLLWFRCYIGYEHGISGAYAKELCFKRKNASLCDLNFQAAVQLCASYVNFGEPIQLNQYLERARTGVDQKKDDNSMGTSKTTMDEIPKKKDQRHPATKMMTHTLTTAVNECTGHSVRPRLLASTTCIAL